MTHIRRLIDVMRKVHILVYTQPRRDVLTLSSVRKSGNPSRRLPNYMILLNALDLQHSAIINNNNRLLGASKRLRLIEQSMELTIH